MKRVKRRCVFLGDEATSHGMRVSVCDGGGIGG